jgi:hypothetical protein
MRGVELESRAHSGETRCTAEIMAKAVEDVMSGEVVVSWFVGYST